MVSKLWTAIGLSCFLAWTGIETVNNNRWVYSSEQIGSKIELSKSRMRFIRKEGWRIYVDGKNIFVEDDKGRLRPYQEYVKERVFDEYGRQKLAREIIEKAAKKIM